MKKVGIYSGTFDPIHHGHISFANLASRLIGLEKVIFFPERSPRGKHNITNVEHRKKMIELAISEEPKLEVDLVSDKNMTFAKSMPKLINLFSGYQLVLLLGSDVFYSLHTWEGLEKFAKDIGFIVGVRGAMPMDFLEDAKRKAEFAVGKLLDVHFINPMQDHMSSTKVRRGSLNFSPQRVREYISEHGLYAIP